ncbi:alpha/beta hydrolase [Roseomonas marmotae]|uniref:Alpha/beta hydrolase n=1 Tax=Roseomonas marmotae TaxID=2768161 RepID=A0ABS3KHH5_9PROT|nr:alpha/beta hydrolase [Roseomonas marmotae]MBO1076914.1 alpha/beta hydrolase [Roseomonas marmotae]
MEQELDPQVAALLRQVNTQPPMHQTPIPALRARRPPPELPVPAIGGVQDVVCRAADGQVPARLYQPPGAASGTLVVFFHGGGFVFGSLDSHYDVTCRALCAGAGCHVLSVDYRLAPEHPFPAAVQDADLAVDWAMAEAATLGADPRRIVLAGGSAGGNLAAVAAQRARGRGGPEPCGQLLFYPVTDAPGPTSSYRDFAQGFYLTRADMDWFWRQYLPNPAQGTDPAASPLRTADLAGLPPALIITAGHDPLRDEAEAYAARLRQAQVPVVLQRYPGMIHGFLAFPLAGRQSALDLAIAWLRELPSAG